MMRKLLLIALISSAFASAQSLERQVIGSSGTSFSNATAQLDFTVGELAVTTLSNGTNDLTQGFHQTNLQVTIKVAPAAFLQGPLLTSGTSVMDDGLRANGHLPTVSPYGDAISADASVFNVTGNDAIIDWVWVELRDETDNTMVVAATSALMQADGDIVATDGVSPVSFDISAKNYYVAVNHRNHLGIMTNAAVALSTTSATVDFRDGTLATNGTNAQTTFGIVAGDYAMWAGDALNNGDVKFQGSSNDSNAVRDDVVNAPGNIFGSIGYEYDGYHDTDINMNGSTKFSGSGNDSNIIRDNIVNHPGNIFGSITFVFNEQL